MPGAPLLHGYPSAGSSGNSPGASRMAAASAPLNVGFPGNLSFFVWLVLIGVVLPVLVVGGLKVGGFQFVFKGR